MSTMEAQAQETEVVQGMVVGIIQKGLDKWQVAVKADPTSQYSKNLWTKDAALIGSLQPLIGSEQAFLCGVSHWTNQQGAPVRSLWINGVGPGVAATLAQPGVAATGGSVGAVPPPTPGLMQTVGQVMQQPGVVPQQPQQAAWVDSTEAKIHRQTASKVAVHLMAFLPPEVPRTYDTLLALCERLVAYYDHGVQTPPEPTSSYYDGDPDGDIPF